MSHVRNQIRAAVKSAVTNLNTTGSHVYTSRTHKLTDNDLPALRIYTDNEEIERLCKTPVYIRHRLPVVIECCVKESGDVDDKVDTITSEVETAIVNDATLAALIKDKQIISTDIEYSNELELPLAIARVTFTIEYHTIDGAPEVAL